MPCAATAAAVAEAAAPCGGRGKAEPPCVPLGKPPLLPVPPLASGTGTPLERPVADAAVAVECVLAALGGPPCPVSSAAEADAAADAVAVAGPVVPSRPLVPGACCTIAPLELPMLPRLVTDHPPAGVPPPTVVLSLPRRRVAMGCGAVDSGGGGKGNCDSTCSAICGMAGTAGLCHPPPPPTLPGCGCIVNKLPAAAALTKVGSHCGRRVIPAAAAAAAAAC